MLLKAIIYEGPKTIALRETAEPALKEGFAKVKVVYTGICGGDIGVYNGTHPRAKAPLIMGHEAAGTIAEGHPNLPVSTPVAINPLITCGCCAPCQRGDKHVCQKLGLYGIDDSGGMAEYITVPLHRIIPLPEGLCLKTGALAEPVAVVVHAIRETGYLPGDNALIFGAGPIGLALALALRAFGCTNLAIVEVNGNRRAFAENLGFDTIDPGTSDVVKEALGRTEGNGADHVYDCAGHQSVADLLPHVVRIKGKIIVVAHYKKKPETDFALGMFKEFSIFFVRVYRDDDFKIATDLLKKEPAFAKLITHVLPPTDAQKGFDMMLDPATTAVKILFNFEGGV
jgi:2-desacetyl-2-hydroxyethyl bacteriochlorophyllide A dehydrogenase